MRCAVAEAYERGDLKPPISGLPQRGAIVSAVGTLRRTIPAAIEAARRDRNAAAAAECATLLEAVNRFPLLPAKRRIEKPWHKSAITLAAAYRILIDCTGRWSRDSEAIRFVEEALKAIGSRTYTGERDAIRKVVMGAGM